MFVTIDGYLLLLNYIFFTTLLISFVALIAICLQDSTTFHVAPGHIVWLMVIYFLTISLVISNYMHSALHLDTAVLREVNSHQ